MKYTVFFFSFFLFFFGFFKEIYENICSCPTGINPKFGFINQLLGRKWGIPPPQYTYMYMSPCTKMYTKRKQKNLIVP